MASKASPVALSPVNRPAPAAKRGPRPLHTAHQHGTPPPRPRAGRSFPTGSRLQVGRNAPSRDSGSPPCPEAAMRHALLITLVTLLLTATASARDEGGVKPTSIPVTAGP
ncbi:hypothetical protein GCM10008939_23390 [Deinococcus aquiradiocola]|uniref:Uncharacterized protein n=1 Tax=Deinococcus aquiradiocola TaxID=393059 RepID=A0A917PHB4_9DEIO|nr:hypothetical protein GCM10008939_23390 [Deinococcus aquiradiocola]